MQVSLGDASSSGHHTRQQTAGQIETRGSQRDPHFVAPLFLTGIQITAARGSYAGRTKVYVERTRDVRRRTGNVRRAYAGRTHYTASTRTISLTVFFLRFSRRFWPSLRGFPRFLRFSDCPRVADSPQAGTAWTASRQTCSPWMVSFPSCFWLFLSESASSGTALFRRPCWAALLSGLRGLRFVLPFFFRGPGAVALGHTGSLLGCSEQGVLFPEGSKVMIKELLKACPFLMAQSTQLNSTQEASKRRASRPGPTSSQLKNRKASRL